MLDFLNPFDNTISIIIFSVVFLFLLAWWNNVWKIFKFIVRKEEYNDLVQIIYQNVKANLQNCLMDIHITK